MGKQANSPNNRLGSFEFQRLAELAPSQEPQQRLGPSAVMGTYNKQEPSNVQPFYQTFTLPIIPFVSAHQLQPGLQPNNHNSTKATV